MIVRLAMVNPPDRPDAPSCRATCATIGPVPMRGLDDTWIHGFEFEADHTQVGPVVTVRGTAVAAAGTLAVDGVTV
ncbi:MAG: hypothetical protein JNL98_14485 [Bryobacterales bacterium]|nr:hypothetical protein [Bryobacterales bacterium]